MRTRNRKTAVVTAFLLSAAFATAQTNPYAGLWIGRATLDAVSQFAGTAPDLSFDLSLTAQDLEDTLISTGTAWRYHDGGTNLGTAWYATNYVDVGWSNGVAELGYGETDLQTVIRSNNQTTVYFRKTFTSVNPTNYSTMRLRIRRDDAAAVYLNGQKVYTFNLPSYPTYGTYALSQLDGASETNYDQVSLAKTFLKTGTNVLAAEVHQYRANDEDLRFNLELVAVKAQSSAFDICPLRSTWSYRAEASAPESDWTEITYAPTGWTPNGSAPLGYGEPDGRLNTIVNSGPSSSRYKTTYFRKVLQVADPSVFSHLDIALLRDDGAAVYINGQEVLRSNLPEDTPIDYDTPPVATVSSAEESAYVTERISSSYLAAGSNVVAVEIHQHAGELGEVVEGVPVRAPAEYDLRLLIHVDANGQARLLKDVIQMWKDGTYAPAPDGTNVVVDEPGRYVLLTDDSLIANYTGAGYSDNTPIGRRFSAVVFDFDGQTLEMSGSFTNAGGGLTVTNTIGPGFRTNPFLHRYHPDHDNLDADFDPLPAGQEEAYGITRVIALDFSSRYPPNPFSDEAATAPPEWGTSRVGGMYEETVSGLHKSAIRTSGPFELWRVSDVSVLNDEMP